MPPRRSQNKGGGGGGKQQAALPAPPPAASPADAALAVAGVAAHVVALLMGAARGEAADLARAECVCTALRRAAAPHWRALCCTLSPAVVRRTAAPADDHARWRRLYRQLHAATFLMADPHCSCGDFVFLVDVMHKGAPLFSACMGPFTGAEHERLSAGSHELVATAAEGAPESAPPRVTAGDLYDWPKRFRARVYAQRCADGALAAVMLDVQPSAPVADMQGDDSSEDGDDDEPAIPLTMAALTFGGSLPLMPNTGSDGSDGSDAPPLYLQLYLEAEDGAADPLFFRTPGYRYQDEPPAGGGGHRPRMSKQEIEKPTGMVFSRDEPCDLPIERAALARRVVLRRAPLCAATLTFGYGNMGCSELCAELDMLNFEPA
jgi:hypothetical protein